MASKLIAFKLSPQKAAELQKKAAEDDRSLSSYLRKIIDLHLKSIKSAGGKIGKQV